MYSRNISIVDTSYNVLCGIQYLIKNLKYMQFILCSEAD